MKSSILENRQTAVFISFFLFVDTFEDTIVFLIDIWVQIMLRVCVSSPRSVDAEIYIPRYLLYSKSDTQSVHNFVILTRLTSLHTPVHTLGIWCRKSNSTYTDPYCILSRKTRSLTKHSIISSYTWSSSSVWFQKENDLTVRLSRFSSYKARRTSRWSSFNDERMDAQLKSTVSKMSDDPNWHVNQIVVYYHHSFIVMFYRNWSDE